MFVAGGSGRPRVVRRVVEERTDDRIRAQRLHPGRLLSAHDVIDRCTTHGRKTGVEHLRTGGSDSQRTGKPSVPYGP